LRFGAQTEKPLNWGGCWLFALVGLPPTERASFAGRTTPQRVLAAHLAKQASGLASIFGRPPRHLDFQCQ
jgi:hypothetical protein